MYIKYEDLEYKYLYATKKILIFALVISYKNGNKIAYG